MSHITNINSITLNFNQKLNKTIDLADYKSADNLIINVESNLEISFINYDYSQIKKLVFNLKENSIVNFECLFEKELDTFNFIEVNCEQDSTFNLNFLITQSSKLNLNFLLNGENSNINVFGAYLLNNSNNVEILTAQNHLAANTTSNIDIRGLLLDESKSIYKGNIFIDKNSPNSSANQINKNILLSEKSHAVSIPSLEVLTDQVKCSHGSASGPFDEEHLNYLMSRGLSLENAKITLLKAFFADLNLGSNLDKSIYNFVFLSFCHNL